MQADIACEPALFRSTHAALTFAFNATAATQGTSVIGRLMGGPAPEGRGLGGLNGVAQAGLIKAEILAMEPRIRGQIIIARFAVRAVTCSCRMPCCSGERENQEWQRAIGEISDIVLREALHGSIVSYLLRRAIVRRYFGQRISFTEAAERAGLDRHTASAHASRVIPYLRDHERMARYEIEGRLKAAAIVE
jgi:uncharacterized protein YidB (DUF937 family)